VTSQKPALAIAARTRLQFFNASYKWTD